MCKWHCNATAVCHLCGQKVAPPCLLAALQTHLYLAGRHVDSAEAAVQTHNDWYFVIVLVTKSIVFSELKLECHFSCTFRHLY